MGEIGKLEEHLRQSQKMEAVGRLAGGVAHDFNNLLMVIQSYTEMLFDALPEGSRLRRYPDQIMQVAQRAAGLTGQLLSFSRKSITAPVVLNLNDIVQQSSKMLTRLMGEDVEFRLISKEPLNSIEADPDQLFQVLMNLCVNARDAMPTGGKITIATDHTVVDNNGRRSQSYVPPGEYVVLSIADSGCGMSPSQLEHIFEPSTPPRLLGKEPASGWLPFTESLSRAVVMCG